MIGVKINSLMDTVDLKYTEGKIGRSRWQESLEMLEQVYFNVRFGHKEAK